MKPKLMFKIIIQFKLHLKNIYEFSNDTYDYVVKVEKYFYIYKYTNFIIIIIIFVGVS